MIRFALFLILLSGSAAAHDKAAHTSAAPKVEVGFGVEKILVREIEVADDSGARFPLVETLAAQGTLLISFTYTNCETLCPLTNAILSGVEEDATGRAVPLTIVSLSIDPLRDTPSALAEQRALLGAGPDWLFLTAQPGPHGQLMSNLGVDLGSLEDHDPMFLLGDFCTGTFTRIIGVPEPARLVDLAESHSPCGS